RPAHLPPDESQDPRPGRARAVRVRARRPARAAARGRGPGAGPALAAGDRGADLRAASAPDPGGHLHRAAPGLAGGPRLLRVAGRLRPGAAEPAGAAAGAVGWPV